MRLWNLSEIQNMSKIDRETKMRRSPGTKSNLILMLTRSCVRLHAELNADYDELLCHIRVKRDMVKRGWAQVTTCSIAHCTMTHVNVNNKIIPAHISTLIFISNKIYTSIIKIFINFSNLLKYIYFSMNFCSSPY